MPLPILQRGEVPVCSGAQRRWVTLAGNETTYTRYEAVMRTGRTPTGKTWARWSAESLTTYRVTKAGYWLYTQRKGNQFTYSERVFAGGHEDKHYADALAHFGREPAAFHDVYPLAHSLALSRYGRFDSAFLSCWVGTNDVGELTRRLFGKRAYRKDLVKAVAASHASALAWAWLFRGFIPVNWIVAFLRSGVFLRPRNDPAPAVRKHLRHRTPGELKRLLNSTGEGFYIRDCGRLPPAEGIGRVRSWRELHDRLDARNRARLGAMPKSQRASKPVTLPAEVQALNGQTAGGLTVVMASTEEQLIAWGSELSHCIASYWSSLRAGRCLLGAVYRQDTLLGTFELDGQVQRIRQFRGRFNQPIPDDIYADVRQHLSQHSSRAVA